MISRKRWDAGANPLEMLNSLHRGFTRRNQIQQRDRKLQLYLLALCRQGWDHSLWLCKKIVELNEASIEGTFSPEVLRQPLDYIAEGIFFSADMYPSFNHKSLADYERYVIELGFEKPVDADAHIDFSDLARLTRQASLAERASAPFFHAKSYQEMPAHQHSVELIRDIFGNPFRPVSFDPTWRTTTSVAIAKAMYDSRDFAAMPVLADALEDAGCTHADILDHCRGAGPHVRGCWVVDLVLGKE